MQGGVMKWMLGFVVLFLFSVYTLAGNILGIDRELNRIKTDFALIIPTHSAIDYPLWAPNSESIAANISGKWVKVNLKHIILLAGKWSKNQNVGVMKYQTSLSEPLEEELREWRKVASLTLKNYSGKTGVKVELIQEGDSTKIIITSKNSHKEVWKTSVEHCHNLAPSPNGKYVAFICDKNGVIIMRLTKS